MHRTVTREDWLVERRALLAVLFVVRFGLQLRLRRFVHTRGAARGQRILQLLRVRPRIEDIAGNSVFYQDASGSSSTRIQITPVAENGRYTPRLCCCV